MGTGLSGHLDRCVGSWSTGWTRYRTQGKVTSMKLRWRAATPTCRSLGSCCLPYDSDLTTDYGLVMSTLRWCIDTFFGTLGLKLGLSAG